MRKNVLMLVALSVAGLVSSASHDAGAQRRRRARPAPVAPAAPTEPPESPAIDGEIAGIEWGANHEQVIAYWRDQARQRYQPQLRGLGLIEQDRLLAQRDAEVAAIANSYIVFNGQQNQRRWDSTFIGEEFLHNNNESMLAREDLQSGTREFFFFINDRLWKRFQARRVPPGGLDFATFAASLEGLFGPGLHRPREGAGAVSGQEVVLWQSGRTRLRVFDQSQFHSVFCLVYEEKVLADHMAEVRRERAEREAAARRQTQDTNQGAPVEDRNEDVVDRITGQSRATPSAAPSGAPSAGPSARP